MAVTAETAAGQGLPVTRLSLSHEEVVRSWQAERPRLSRTVPVSSVLKDTIPLYTINGEITPQGWLISKTLRYKNQLRELTQEQADQRTATTLGIPCSWAVLFRMMTNVNPGSNITRPQTFEQFLMKPEYYFDNATKPLMDLATKVDALKKSDWERMQEEVAEKHRDGGEGNQFGDLTMRPSDLTKIVRQAFIIGADYATTVALGLNGSLTTRPGYKEFERYDTLLATGLAAVEILHTNRLVRSGHNFFYTGLFNTAHGETVIQPVKVAVPEEVEATKEILSQPATSNTGLKNDGGARVVETEVVRRLGVDVRKVTVASEGVIHDVYLPVAVQSLNALTNSQDGAKEITTSKKTELAPKNSDSSNTVLPVFPPSQRADSSKPLATTRRAGLGFVLGKGISWGTTASGLYLLQRTWANGHWASDLDAKIIPARAAIRQTDSRLAEIQAKITSARNDLSLTKDPVRQAQINQQIQAFKKDLADFQVDKNVELTKAKPLEDDAAWVGNRTILQGVTGFALTFRKAILWFVKQMQD